MQKHPRKLKPWVIKNYYPFFLKESERLLKPHGIIFADNILYKGYVMSDYNKHKQRTAVNKLRNFIDIVMENKNLDSSLHDIGDGLMVCKVIKN